MLKSFIYIGETSVGKAVTESLIAEGFVVAPTREEAEVFLVYGESQSDLEDIFFDAEGVIQLASVGAYCINLSASTPLFARELNAVAVVNDLHAVDAPLVVHDVTASNVFEPSNLSCLLSGEKEDIEQVKPMIAGFVKSVQVVGDGGSAQIARAALTIQNTAQWLAASEAEILCKACGISGEAVDLFAQKEGLITPAALRFSQAIREERFEGAFTVQMWINELSAALAAADEAQVILPGTEACVHLLNLLITVGGFTKSPTALSLVYGDESLGARHGLDWTRAEQTYTRDSDDDDDYYEDDEGTNEGFSGGLSEYSLN